LIGAGRWGRNYIRTIRGMDGVLLGRVASGNPDTAAMVPAACRVVAHWHDVVGAPDIDGLIVASPPATHFEVLEAAIARGMPVLVEKPVVHSQDHALEIRAMLGRRPVPILVDHVHLFHPAFRALRREAARIGPVRAIHSSAGNHGPYRTDVSVLWDWAPHDLAMSLALVPGAARPITAACLEARMIEGVPAERIGLELAIGDVPVHIQVSTLHARHRWFAVRLEDCTLVYRDTGDHPLMRLLAEAAVDGQGTDLPVPSAMPPLTTAVLEFAEAIRTGSLDMTSINLGLTAVELLSGFERLYVRGPAGDT
jgi:predicted dehydrogenase